MSKDNIELPPLPEPFTYVFPNVERNQLFHTKHMQDYARDAIKADRQQRTSPECWQLVPKEPTEEMLEGTESYLINPDGEPVDIVRVTKSQYRELLAASPKFGEEE